MPVCNPGGLSDLGETIVRRGSTSAVADPGAAVVDPAAEVEAVVVLLMPLPVVPLKKYAKSASSLLGVSDMTWSFSPFDHVSNVYVLKF